MHRIEGLNFSLDSTGKHIFKDSPPATTVPATWLNAVQEEIANAIEGAGLVLSSQNADPKNQLYQAMIKQDIYDYLVNSSQAWYNIIERTAANTYQFKSGYKSIYFKYITGGYSINTVLSGGDTWGVIKTNETINLEFESGAYINVGDTPSYIEINTDDCALENIYLKGIGTVAVSITQSFLLNAYRVQFLNCKTSDRKSNSAFSGFKGSVTLLHNTTSKYTDCSEWNLDSSSSVYGFYGCYNLSSCIGYSNSCSNAICMSFRDCYNLSNCIGDNNTGITIGTGIGFYGCYNLSNCIGNDNSSISGDSYGFYGCYNLSNCIGNDNVAGIGGVGSGFKSCISLSNCTGDGNNGAASGFGFMECKKCQQNKGTGNATATYNTSYADSAAANACADTAAGGYNS